MIGNPVGLSFVSKPPPRDERNSRPTGIDAQPEDPADLWTPPPKAEWEQLLMPLALDESSLLTARLERWNGQLVDWAVVWSKTQVDGTPREQMCIDTGHGFIHKHVGRHRRETAIVIRPILTQDDVQDSYALAYDEVYDAYLEDAKVEAENNDN